MTRDRRALLVTLLILVVLVGSVVGSAALTDAPHRVTETRESSAPPSATSHAIGTLVSATKQALVVEESASDSQPSPRHSYRITPDISFCRRTCTDTWRALRPGDFIDGWLAPIHPGQTRPSLPVYVNFVADRTLVDSVDGNRVVVRTTHVAAPKTRYTLLIDPSTPFVLPDGREVKGYVSRLEAGDWLYYVGARDRPSSMNRVWAYRVFLSS